LFTLCRNSTTPLEHATTHAVGHLFHISNSPIFHLWCTVICVFVVTWCQIISGMREMQGIVDRLGGSSHYTYLPYLSTVLPCVWQLLVPSGGCRFLFRRLFLVFLAFLGPISPANIAETNNFILFQLSGMNQ
jgi:hypothetical protein